MLTAITRYLRRHHVGLLALVIALTGTAVAATKIGPREIKRNAVHGYHVKNNQIGAKDLRRIRHSKVVTALIPDPDGPGDWGVGVARATCPKGFLAIGVRTDWPAGSQPSAIHKFTLRGRSAVVTGITDGGGIGSNTARLAVQAECLPAGK